MPFYQFQCVSHTKLLLTVPSVLFAHSLKAQANSKSERSKHTNTGANIGRADDLPFYLIVCVCVYNKTLDTPFTIAIESIHFDFKSILPIKNKSKRTESKTNKIGQIFVCYNYRGVHELYLLAFRFNFIWLHFNGSTLSTWKLFTIHNQTMIGLSSLG